MTSIFIIEDEMLILEDIVLILELNNLEASGSADPRAGIEQILAQPPDLIFCDVSMPHMDGHAVLQKLRDELGENLPVFIFLSAFTSDKAIENAIRLGATDYLTKPFSEAQLIAMVQKHLP